MSNFLEDLFGLKDKTAVVIGGTGVLCGEIAPGLAQAGAEIVIVGRNPTKQPGAYPPSNKPGAVDISSPVK